MPLSELVGRFTTNFPRRLNFDKANRIAELRLKELMGRQCDDNRRRHFGFLLYLIVVSKLMAIETQRRNFQGCSREQVCC